RYRLRPRGTHVWYVRTLRSVRPRTVRTVTTTRNVPFGSPRRFTGARRRARVRTTFTRLPLTVTTAERIRSPRGARRRRILNERRLVQRREDGSVAAAGACSGPPSPAGCAPGEPGAGA